MQHMSLFIAAIFLPLFPLGMIFNAVFQRIRNPWLRAVLLIVWPLAGVGLIQLTSLKVTDVVVVWALCSAVLYGYRAVVVREIGVWTGFLATSAWSLVWIAHAAGMLADELTMYVLAFSLPLVLLVFLTAELERRYESAYAGIVCGIAQAQPRLSGVFVLTLLAAIGSPLFPGFFAMLNSITHAAVTFPLVASGVAVVWLMWSWSGIRLLQELMVGRCAGTQADDDIAQGMTLTYGLSLLLLVMGGLFVSGVML